MSFTPPNQGVPSVLCPPQKNPKGDPQCHLSPFLDDPNVLCLLLDVPNVLCPRLGVPSVLCPPKKTLKETPNVLSPHFWMSPMSPVPPWISSMSFLSPPVSCVPPNPLK